MDLPGQHFGRPDRHHRRAPRHPPFQSLRRRPAPHGPPRRDQRHRRADRAHLRERNAETWGWGSARFIWLSIFAKRTIAVVNATMLTFAGGLFVTMFFPTLYLAENMGYSPIKIGLAYLPWPVAMMAAGSVGQKLLAKTGPRLLLVAGLLLVAVGLLAFVRLSVDGSYAADVLPGLLLTAIGAGLVFNPVFMVATTGVSAEESGLASGVINTSQQLGSALGLAAISTLASGNTAHPLTGTGDRPTAAEQSCAMVEGFQHGFVIAAAVVTVNALIAALGLRKRDFAPGADEAQDTAQPVPTHVS
ncbi:MFS transporter [Streptomyces sp. TRM75561]|uniref:MFS transporter n=1 Tax=Streptomyces sp. TRM75561 TaxID=2975269 RepID=UPI00244D1294|nr:MFS transporter [Streptomyces sp. TRM75561]MDH3038927.1 MFS transporter [Streptomyces sp. TRM75561]